MEIIKLNRQQAQERQADSSHHLQHATAHHFLELGEAWERTKDTGSKERNPEQEIVKGSRRMVVRKSDGRKILRKGTPKKYSARLVTLTEPRKCSDGEQKMVSPEKTVQRSSTCEKRFEDDKEKEKVKELIIMEC